MGKKLFLRINYIVPMNYIVWSYAGLVEKKVSFFRSGYTYKLHSSKYNVEHLEMEIFMCFLSAFIFYAKYTHHDPFSVYRDNNGKQVVDIF